MSKVFWDSMIFIYWMENHPVFAKRARHILGGMAMRGDRLFTSAFAAAEVLVGPTRTGDVKAIAGIDGFFRSPAVTVLPFTMDAGKHYSEVRVKYVVRPPDAIHLACAAAEGIDVFITNDKNLVGKSMPGIQFIVGLDTNLF